MLLPGWGIHPYDKQKVIDSMVSHDLPAGSVLESERSW